MPPDVKKDDSSIDNSIGIESSIVKVEDCTTDDINVHLEFYFGDQLIANETFRVSIKRLLSHHGRCPRWLEDNFLLPSWASRDLEI